MMTNRTMTFLPAVIAATFGSAGMAQKSSPAPAAASFALPPAPNALRVDRNVEYARVANHSLTLDIYRSPAPAAGAASEPSPVIVWIHGGERVGGDKFPTPAAQFVANGYAIVSVDYRPAGEASFPAPLYDVKAAIRWIRAHAADYGFDPDHIGAWGYSAGGQLAALLGTTAGVKELEGKEGNPDQSSHIQAVVDFAGPIDLTRLDESARPAGSGLRDSPAARTLSQDADAARTANPIGYITPDDPPFLIVHGAADTQVSPRQSEFFQIALKRAGVEDSLEYVVGAGHDIIEVLTPAVAEKVASFFDTHLRGGKRQRDDIFAIHVQTDAFEDPIMADGYGGTRYELYATPASRGPGTHGSYRIFYPPGYDLPGNAKRRYPVIYYLHGKTNDSRSGVTNGYVPRADAAMRSGVMPPAIIILVQGLSTSGYFDSVDGRYPMESEIIKDLIPHIDRTYRTVASREARALEGHSMGGNGVLHLAFKYPDLFGSVASLSAAINPIAESGGTKDRLNAMFIGDAARAEAEEAWTLAEKNADRIRGRMSVRMIVGDKDNLQARNQWFSDLLTRLKIDHSLTMSKGAPHDAREVLARLETNPFAYYSTVFAAFK